MVAWSGFRCIILPFEPPQRLAGESKYSLGKMLRLAADAIFSFSNTPLRLATYTGLATVGLAVLGGVLMLYLRLFTNYTIPGIKPGPRTIHLQLYGGAVNLYDPLAVIGDEAAGGTVHEIAVPQRAVPRGAPCGRPGWLRRWPSPRRTRQRRRRARPRHRRCRPPHLPRRCRRRCSSATPRCRRRCCRRRAGGSR